MNDLNVDKSGTINYTFPLFVLLDEQNNQSNQANNNNPIITHTIFYYAAKTREKTTRP